MAWNAATALDALRSRDLLEVGMLANQLRLDLHPENVVTYELGGRPSLLAEAASNSGSGCRRADVDLDRISDLESYSLDALETSLLSQRGRFPDLAFQHLPITRLKSVAGDLLAFAESLPRLHIAGLRSIRVELQSGLSTPRFEDLRGLFRGAADCGLCAAVSITIGSSESVEQRMDALNLLRDLQQDSGSIQVVLVRVHHAGAAARREEEATAVDYLRTLAVTRLFLENVEHIQTDWSVMGPKVLELALRFGADDAGAVPWSQPGSPVPSHHGGESELRRIIRDAGFRPVERDSLFRQCLLR
jgi:cyclic dehypoxanthinyl futalosine synthase